MRRVGLAPGTTTLTLQDAPRGHTIPTPDFASPWNPAYPDPSQTYMPKGATIVGGAMVPHDFELAKIYGYTPYMQGWTVARIAKEGGTPEEVAYTTGYLKGLGQSILPGEPTPGTTPPSEMTREELERRLLEERLKSEKTIRTWTIVGGAVGVAGLVLALFSLGRR